MSFADLPTLQLWALVILVLDELPVKLSGDEEVLWRMFYRRCGMTRKEFQHVRPQQQPLCSYQRKGPYLLGPAHLSRG